MEENQQIIFMVVIIFLGVISTVVYYFARYYFRTHELDDEVVSSLKEKAELVSGKKSLSEELDSAAEPVPVVATKDLRSALKNTKTSLLGRMTEVFSSQESLSEEDLEMMHHYDVWVEKNLYGKKYMGIERSTFLIDKEGIIRGVWRKVRVKGHVEEVLDAAKKLKK